MSIYELLSIIIAVMALLSSLCTYYISKKLLKQNLQMLFFAEYTKRYQAIEMGLMSEDEKQRYRYFRLYFDLCSEEYFLYSKKYLSAEVWEMWKDGMRLLVKYKELQTEWKRRSQFYNEEFCQFFRNIIKDSINNQTSINHEKI